MADWSRTYDLEELYALRAKAPDSKWRERYEWAIDRILRENDIIGEERHKLISAIRKGDKKEIRRANERLNLIRLYETNGHSY